MVRGWKQATELTPLEMIAELQRYCCAFLYTHIETEGLMCGIPLDVVTKLRTAVAGQLIVAGGIRTNEEVERLDRINVDAVVGMAIYTGQGKSPEAIGYGRFGIRKKARRLKEAEFSNRD